LESYILKLKENNEKNEYNDEKQKLSGKESNEWNNTQNKSNDEQYKSTISEISFSLNEELNNNENKVVIEEEKEITLSCKNPVINSSNNSAASTIFLKNLKSKPKQENPNQIIKYDDSMILNFLEKFFKNNPRKQKKSTYYINYFNCNNTNKFFNNKQEYEDKTGQKEENEFNEVDEENAAENQTRKAKSKIEIITEKLNKKKNIGSNSSLDFTDYTNDEKLILLTALDHLKQKIIDDDSEILNHSSIKKQKNSSLNKNDEIYTEKIDSFTNKELKETVSI